MDSTTAVCADCDSKNPQWASINRGVFVCDECNSIHRQLGRHVSQTKHLTKSLWRPSQLFMVQYLALAGANRFWEHILLEPFLNKNHDENRGNILKSSKKPQPNSMLHSTKAEFIKEKYLFHGFFKRPQVVYPDDLNLQLHASVRTAVLETSLYLLALGANPNFSHPTKGTSPVHVACQYEQVGQLELLIAYGGDVCMRSTNGISPLEIALEKAQTVQGSGNWPSLNSPWSPLIECIVSAFYELTDGLSFYLCRRVPDHQAAVFLGGQKPPSTAATGGPTGAFYGPGHFLVASSGVVENGRCGGEESDDVVWLADAKDKLKNLKHLAFEDLCIDVYDEAERRLTNAILEPLNDEVVETGIGGMPLPLDRPHSVATPICSAKHSLALFFLPPNTAYSSIRNQARQKLGRLSMTEFRALVVDVLTEAAGRLVALIESSQPMLPLPQPKRIQQHNYVSYELPPAIEPAGKRHSPRPLNPVTEPQRQHLDSVNDDPVYDQVASEQDTLSQRSPNRSASIVTTNSTSASLGNGAVTPYLNRKPTTSSTTTTQPSSDPSWSVDQSTEVMVVLDGLSVSVSDPVGGGRVEEGEQGDNLPRLLSSISYSSPGIGGGGINSKPGPVPGSRRLHLPHTDRLSSYRASVPSGQQNGASQTSPSVDRQPQRIITRPLQRSVEVQVSRPCDDCFTREAEVDRLKAAKLALDTDKMMLADDKAKLESRVKQLENAELQLIDANEALKAALSAGLVMSHERSGSSTVAVPVTKLLKDSTPPISSTTNPPVNCSGDEKHGLGIADEDEEEEEYSYNEDVSSVRAGSVGGGGGAYSMGTECLDSGIMLRQGIWGTPASPAPLSEESRAALKSSPGLRTTPAAPAVNCCSSFVSRADSQPLVAVAGAQRSYVNLTSKAGGRQMQNNGCHHDSPISSRNRFPPEGSSRQPLSVHHEVDATDDYTSPNETGSPSPAPLPTITAGNPRNVTTTPLWNPPPITNNNQSRPSPKSPEGTDYIVPGASPHLQYKSANSPASLGEHTPPLAMWANPPQWKQPPYERIVRGVECIIVRIRSLLDAANSRRSSDLARSSQAIQAAVQDLVILFPPISKCHSTVGTALTTLMSNSQKLRLHCERNHGENLGANKLKLEPTNPLINFAHEIASAAKTILTFFQNERQ